MASAAVEPTADAGNVHAEREAILQDVIKVFCEKGDVNAVRDAGRTIGELQVAGEVRHKQMLESIKGAPRNPATMGQPTP
eukprot:6606004-Prymnesium_polylepis.1